MSLPLNKYQPYSPLTVPEKYGKLQKMYALFNSFMTVLGYSGISCRKEVLLDIIERVEMRRVYFRVFHGITMAEKNETALYCFWILKLAPFIDNNNPGRHVNVTFAVYLFLEMVYRVGRKKQRKIQVTPKYVHDLRYDFLYRDISKEAIMMAANSFLS